MRWPGRACGSRSALPGLTRSRATIPPSLRSDDLQATMARELSSLGTACFADQAFDIFRCYAAEIPAAGIFVAHQAILAQCPAPAQPRASRASRQAANSIQPSADHAASPSGAAAAIHQPDAACPRSGATIAPGQSVRALGDAAAAGRLAAMARSVPAIARAAVPNISPRPVFNIAVFNIAAFNIAVPHKLARFRR